ncbi:MAG: Bax inhibitor-1/YccA family protein [Ilumatobacteraceae bacterium]
MPNPVFNENSLKQASSTWAAPVRGTQFEPQPVATDGPISTWQPAMTINGTITAALVFFTILLVSAAFGWNAAEGPTLENGVETYRFPGIALLGIIVGFVAVMIAMRKPKLAKWLGAVYAVGFGFAVGAISRGYETFYDGIVVQAAGATAAVFAVMLVLYRTRIIKVTERFRRIVVGATLGIMLFYLVAFVIRLFGGSVPFLDSPSLLGIGFSIFVVGIAAMNLALDFDLVERGVEMRLPKDYEWVGALGIVVTIVWLYLEMLRLLSKLRQ